jgi:Protein of unknown function (DUF2827)
MKKINIGITFREDNYKKNGFFSNGIMQNVISLRDLFEKCKNVNKSYLINTSLEAQDAENTIWQPYKEHIISKEQAKEKCDLIVVCQGSLHVEEYRLFTNLGKKIVKQVLGAELAIFNERVLFDIPAGGVYKRNEYVSDIWASPHFYDRDSCFFEAIYGRKPKLAPYIWTPSFIEKHVKVFQSQNPDWAGKYTPSNEVSKRISVMEANLNLVKTCIVPIFTAELLERKNPELLKFISIFGGSLIKSKSDIIQCVSGFEIQKNKKCFFEARYPIVWTLKEHTDIVLSHQNQCELNYLYLDAAWLGYPVVHNSPMMKDLGWYYSQNDSQTAIKHIEYIAKNFDTNEYIDDKYLIKSRAYASQFLPDNPKNIKGYEKLIEQVFKN